MTTPPYGRDPYAPDPYSLPPGTGGSYPPYEQNPPPYGAPVSPPYGQQPVSPPYGQPVSPSYGQPVSPPYGQPASVQPYSPYAGYTVPAYGTPVVQSYGFDPVTGRPLSDKSKIAAGLLQLLLGALLCLGGVGRLYAGNVALGVTQLVLSLVAWASFWCTFVLLFPIIVFFGLWVWFIVDGIVMLAGRPVDGQGRVLRS